MIDLSNIKNISYDLTQENLNKAENIFRIKDIIDVGDNPLAVSKQEISYKLGEFSKSNIAKHNTNIQGAINGVQSAITVLNIAEKTTEAFKIVKPIVKKAVNVGGIWLNFANVGEIAQDVLQLAFRYLVGLGKDKLIEQINKVLEIPLFISLGDDDSDAIIGIINELETEIKKAIGDFLLDLSLDDYLTLVRNTNNRLTKEYNKTGLSAKYIPYSSDNIINVFEYGDLTYIIKENKVTKTDNNTKESETEVEKENIVDFIIVNNNKYLLYKDGNSVKVEKNGTYLGSVNGEYIKTVSFQNKLTIATNSKLVYTDSLTTIKEGNLLEVSLCDNKLYFSDGHKIYIVEEDLIPVEVVDMETGEIFGISFYDYLFFTHKIGDKTTINRLTEEREFKEFDFPDSNFSFYKEVSNGNKYGYRNGTLFEIKKENGELRAEAISSRMPGDIADIDIINIGGDNYFITSVGPSLFVAKEGFLNTWEEKVIKFEEVGVKEGLISSIKVIGNNIYLSSLRTVMKVKNNNDIKTVKANYVSIDNLDWSVLDNPPINEHPELRVEEELLSTVEIDPASIKTYNDIVYKIVDGDIVSSGKKIYDGNSIKYESVSNIYNFIIKNGVYYYNMKNEVFENSDHLRELEIKGNILGYLNIDGDIYIFTENHYYKETGKLSYIKEIPCPFPLRNKTKMISDGKSLLLYDNYKIFNYLNKNKGVKDLFQAINSPIDKIINTSKVSLLLKEVGVNKLSVSNAVSVDKDFNNGYLINKHFGEGVGIAPFDTRTKIITETIVDKSEYLESLKDEFKDHFSRLMNEIPITTIEKIEKDIIDEALKSGAYKKDEEETRKFISDYLRSSIVSLLKELMQNNFELSLDDKEKFSVELIKRLSAKNANNVTREFYFLAMEYVKRAFENSMLEMFGIELWNVLWSYYNRHKYEWGAQITRGMNKQYVESSEYDQVITPDMDIEVRSEFNNLMNVIVKNEVDAFTLGKTGKIEEVDKVLLRNIISGKPIPELESMTNYIPWIDSITEASGTFYKPIILHKFEDIIDESNMNPIQWDELPSTINRTTFSRLLNILLDRVKEEMKLGLNLLIVEDGVPCFSCVNSDIVYKGIKKEFEDTLEVAKSISAKKLYNLNTYEDTPNKYFIPSGIDTKASLEELLDNQTDLYKSYIIPFIDAVIESSEEVYDEEIPV